MADEIKQPGNVGRVQPPNPARSGAQRKAPRRQPTRDESERRRSRPDDSDPHQVDEYV